MISADTLKRLQAESFGSDDRPEETAAVHEILALVARGLDAMPDVSALEPAMRFGPHCWPSGVPGAGADDE